MITESFGNHIKGSRFPQGGSRMAERGRPRAFDEEEVLDVAMSLQLHDGKSGRSAVASQPAETRDRFSSPSSPQVRRRSSSPLIPVCATAISLAPASKYCSIAAAH